MRNHAFSWSALKPAPIDLIRGTRTSSRHRPSFVWIDGQVTSARERRKDKRLTIPPETGIIPPLLSRYPLNSSSLIADSSWLTLAVQPGGILVELGNSTNRTAPPVKVCLPSTVPGPTMDALRFSNDTLTRTYPLRASTLTVAMESMPFLVRF